MYDNYLGKGQITQDQINKTLYWILMSQVFRAWYEKLFIEECNISRSNFWLSTLCVFPSLPSSTYSLDVGNYDPQDTHREIYDQAKGSNLRVRVVTVHFHSNC